METVGNLYDTSKKMFNVPPPMSLKQKPKVFNEAPRTHVSTKETSKLKQLFNIEEQSAWDFDSSIEPRYDIDLTDFPTLEGEQPHKKVLSKPSNINLPCNVKVAPSLPTENHTLHTSVPTQKNHEPPNPTVSISIVKIARRSVEPVTVVNPPLNKSITILRREKNVSSSLSNIQPSNDSKCGGKEKTPSITVKDLQSRKKLAIADNSSAIASKSVARFSSQNDNPVIPRISSESFNSAKNENVGPRENLKPTKTMPKIVVSCKKKAETICNSVENRSLKAKSHNLPERADHVNQHINSDKTHTAPLKIVISDLRPRIDKPDPQITISDATNLPTVSINPETKHQNKIKIVVTNLSSSTRSS